MMLVLSPHDIGLLSSECQRELRELFFREDRAQLIEIDEAEMRQPEMDLAFGELLEIDDPITDAVTESKQVVEINEVEAKRLIANLSNKSLETLKKFAQEEIILLQDLVGSGKSYSSFAELKRSFIGAVNRRLRTVTKNRGAMLFRKIRSENDQGECIGLKLKSMHSLRAVFEIM